MANENKDVLRVEAANEATLTSTLREKMFGIALDTNRTGWKKTGGSMAWFWDSAALSNASAGTSGAEKVGVPGITGITPDGGSSGGSGNVYTMLQGFKDYIDASPAAAISGSGSVGNLPVFTDTGEIGDSILIESGPTITMVGSGNSSAIFQVYNNSTGASATSLIALTSATSAGGTIYTAASTYTDMAEAANRMNFYCNPFLAGGMNFNAASAVGTIDFYVGDQMDVIDPIVSIGTKAVTVSNVALTTDATGTVGGLLVSTSVEKNDSNTRTFAIQRIKPTFDTGGSNGNTTVNILDIDTTNTATTGLTVNLLNLAYGGSSTLRFASNGEIVSSVSSQVFKKNDDAGTFILCGGDNGSSSDGSMIILSGVSDVTHAGKMRLYSGVGATIDLVGSTTLSGYLKYYAQISTPSSPSAGEVNVYQKGNYIVFQFNDSSTIRYKYLDLTGTGVTWTHSTSAP